MTHRYQDDVSFDLSRATAARLREAPELLVIASENLRRWSQRNADTPSLLRCYQEWEAILRKPLDEILAILCAESDEGQRLRQNSPFPGILTPHEVWAIKRELCHAATSA